MNKLVMFVTLTCFFNIMSITSFSYNIADANRIWGITTDATDNQTAQIQAMSSMCVKPTVRIVFDEWQAATLYSSFVPAVHNVAYIMGEVLDSEYMIQYNLQQYTDRTNEYLNAFGNQVDIWEVGNEVNGEWCGNTSDVVAKISSSYSILKAANKKTALTLYENWNCWSDPANEMFRWTNQNIPSNMKQGLDYVWVSYYEDDCNGYQPDWQRVFDSLHVIFPNSKLGIGECCTDVATLKPVYMTRYYSMNVTTQSYVGGYFWWYWLEDCVPMSSKPLWGVLNNIIGNTNSVPAQNEIPQSFRLTNYPNPFNPETKISFYLPKAEQVSLKIYDLLGNEVASLINDRLNAGNYSVEWNAENYASGIYLYKLQTVDYAQTNKMMLVK